MRLILSGFILEAVYISGSSVRTTCWRGLPSRLAARISFGFAGLFATTLVWIYPIDALDVFDYAMYGRMLAVLGANPYVALPAWFPHDPFLPSVGWKTSSA